MRRRWKNIHWAHRWVKQGPVGCDLLSITLKATQRIFPRPATGECGVGRRVSTLDSAGVFVGDLSSNIWLQGKGILVSILWEKSPEPDQKDATAFENIFGISLVQSFQQVKRPLLGFAFWSQEGTCSPTEEDSLGKNSISEVGRFLSWDNFIHDSRIYLTLLVSSVKIMLRFAFEAGSRWYFDYFGVI